MPVGNNRRRIDGLVSQFPVGINSRTILEQGAEQFSTSGGQQTTIVTPGETRFGQQTQYMPASTLIADALTGAAQGMQSFMQGVEEGDRRASQKSWDNLMVDYFDKVSQGMGPTEIKQWIQHKGYRPDKYTRTQYAKLYADLSEQSVAEWEQDDLKAEQLKFAQLGTDMSGPLRSNISKVTYFQDLIDKSPNEKVRDWATRNIIDLNEREATRLASEVKASLSIDWGNRMDVFAMNQKWSDAIVESSAPHEMAMAVMMGVVRFNDSGEAVIVTPDGEAQMNPQDPNLHVFLQGYLSNEGVYADPEIAHSLKASAARVVSSARDKYVGDVDRRKSLTASLVRSHGYRVPTQDYYGIGLDDPKYANLDLSSPEGRLARDGALRSLAQERLQTFVENNPNATIPDIEAFIEDTKKLPWHDLTADLILGSFGNHILSERGQELMGDIGEDLKFMAAGQQLTRASASLVTTNKEIKEGNLDPMTAVASEAMNIAGAMQYLGVPQGPDGLPSWSQAYERYPKGTAIGNQLFALESRFNTLMSTADKATLGIRVLSDPYGRPQVERAVGMEYLLDPNGQHLRALRDHVNKGNYTDVLRDGTQIGRMTRSLVNPHEEANDALKGTIGELTSNLDDLPSLTAAGSIMGELQGTKAWKDVYDSMKDPQTRLSLQQAEILVSRSENVENLTSDGAKQRMQQIELNMIDRIAAIRSTPTEVIDNMTGRVEHFLKTSQGTRDIAFPMDDPQVSTAVNMMTNLLGPDGLIQVSGKLQATEPGDMNSTARLWQLMGEGDARMLRDALVVGALQVGNPADIPEVVGTLKSTLPPNRKLVMFPSPKTRNDGRAAPQDVRKLNVMFDPAGHFDIHAMERLAPNLFRSYAVGAGGSSLMHETRRQVTKFLDSRPFSIPGLTINNDGVVYTSTVTRKSTTFNQSWESMDPETRVKLMVAAELGTVDLKELQVEAWLPEHMRGNIPEQGVPLVFKVNHMRGEYRLVQIPNTYWSARNVPMGPGVTINETTQDVSAPSYLNRNMRDDFIPGLD